MAETFAKEKKRIAFTSVCAAIFLTTFKFVIGIATNSLGIISEAAHSGLDLLAALMTYFAVRFSDRPADEDHLYGHGKLENISAFLETLLLIVTCIWIIYEAVGKFLSNSHNVEVSVWSFVVMGTSIIIDFSRSRALYKVAKKSNSQALEADALHFASDIWSSLTVIAGLIFVSIGFPEFDAFAALMVAFLVLFVSYRLGRRTIDALMDRAPKGKLQSIEQAIRSVPGVEEVRSIRMRPSGPRLFVDIVVAIRRTLPFHLAHRIMDEIEQAIHAVDPIADVIIHAEPVASNDETLVDKIKMIVIDHRLPPPHNLEVHLSNGKYYVDFDIEYQPNQSFEDAHRIASALESHIMAEITAIEKVTIHMEESETKEHALTDVTTAQTPLSEKIHNLVMQQDGIVKCSDVTLLQDGDHFHLSIVCSLPRTKTLEEVHTIISGIERTLYDNFPVIRKVTIHAEPA